MMHFLRFDELAAVYRTAEKTAEDATNHPIFGKLAEKVALPEPVVADGKLGKDRGTWMCVAGKDDLSGAAEVVRLSPLHIVRVPEELNGLMLDPCPPYPSRDDVRMPFDAMHVEFEAPFLNPIDLKEFSDADVGYLTAVSLCLIDGTLISAEFDYAISAIFHLQRPTVGGIHMIQPSWFPAAVFGPDDNRLRSAVARGWDKSRQIVRNILDVLSLPSVKYERTDFSKLNKKRAKKRQPLKTDYHVVRWVNDHPERGPGAMSGHGSAHQVRYDVRGHWRTYENGSRSWVRPHLRGPDDAPYRPKGYKL